MAKTKHTPEVVERDLVKRYAGRQIKRKLDMPDMYIKGYRAAFEVLTTWLINQPKRTKRKGGIGKK